MSKDTALAEGTRLEIIDHGICEPIKDMMTDARTCYSNTWVDPSTVEMKGLASVFESGHLTTIMAPCDIVFEIDGPSVSTFTFGFHFANPFYNSGQRSGRFCLDMFKEIDIDLIKKRIATYYQLDPTLINRVIDFISRGIDLFGKNILPATELVEKMIACKRPMIPIDKRRQLAKKIAQEQLRVFISTVVPTGDIFKINLVSLANYYQTASTPEMRALVNEMVKKVTDLWSNLKFLFPEQKASSKANDFMPSLKTASRILSYEPKARLRKIDTWPRNQPLPTIDELVPLGLVHSSPRYMDLSTRHVEVAIDKCSVMTYGQKQRHRTIERSSPTFTGEFYAPFAVEGLGLSREARDYMQEWIKIYKLNPSLGLFIVPYGAILKYNECANFKAFINEQRERLCWCAETEIYELSRQTREQIAVNNPNHPLLNVMAPSCFYGHCTEGKRYCGRDLNQPFSFEKRLI